MNYKNGFAKEEFLQYMFNEFFSAYSSPHSRELLTNVIDYCTDDNFTHTKNKLFYTLEKLIPEISKTELLSFFDDKSITDEVRNYCANDTRIIEKYEPDICD